MCRLGASRRNPGAPRATSAAAASCCYGDVPHQLQEDSWQVARGDEGRERARCQRPDVHVGTGGATGHMRQKGHGAEPIVRLGVDGRGLEAREEDEERAQARVEGPLLEGTGGGLQLVQQERVQRGVPAGQGLRVKG